MKTANHHQNCTLKDCKWQHQNNVFLVTFHAAELAPRGYCLCCMSNKERNAGTNRKFAKKKCSMALQVFHSSFAFRSLLSTVLTEKKKGNKEEKVTMTHHALSTRSARMLSGHWSFLLERVFVGQVHVRILGAGFAIPTIPRNARLCDFDRNGRVVAFLVERCREKFRKSKTGKMFRKKLL